MQCSSQSIMNLHNQNKKERQGKERADKIPAYKNNVAVRRLIKFICFSFYGDFFLIFFSVCASQFYDVFFFYHKAYLNKFCLIINYCCKDLILSSMSFLACGNCIRFKAFLYHFTASCFWPRCS